MHVFTVFAPYSPSYTFSLPSPSHWYPPPPPTGPVLPSYSIL
jgi:hypothetical protein